MIKMGDCCFSGIYIELWVGKGGEMEACFLCMYVCLVIYS